MKHTRCAASYNPLIKALILTISVFFSDSIKCVSDFVEDAPKGPSQSDIQLAKKTLAGRRKSDLPADAPIVSRDKREAKTKAKKLLFGKSTLPTPVMWRPLDPDVTVFITPYGFVRLKAFYDTRQVIGLRDSHVLLVPAPKKLDVNCRDINSHHQFYMSAIDTRMGFEFTGPKWECIETSAIIETDFHGISEDTINLIRMRHAFGKVSWVWNSRIYGSFIFGQFWHPLWAPDCFPNTVSFNFGAPIEIYSRMPQLRLTERVGNFEFILAALEERDFRSSGPIGLSPRYMIDAFPNFHAQVRYYWSDHVFGLAGDYKRLVPRIETDKCFKVEERIDSFITEIYAAFNFLRYSFRCKTYYAQNDTAHLGISGYAVRTVNPITDKRTYTNIASVGAWLDFSYFFCDDNIELGLFVGGVKNLGARHNIFFDPETGCPIIFSLAEPFFSRLDYLFRIMPRYVWARDPLRFGFEIDFDRAGYGCIDERAKVQNLDPVNLLRILAVFEFVY